MTGSGIASAPQTVDLRDIVRDALELAERQGASQTEVAVADSSGFSATVRLGEVETVEHNRDKSLMLTVFFGHCSGSASTSDFTRAALEDTVRAACSIARYTAEDPHSGLADPDLLATEFPDLDLYAPWDIEVDQAIELAAACEQAARDEDARITNSEGATVSTHTGREVYGNSLGFLGDALGSRHTISCAVLGSLDDAMQRDYWYTSARHPGDLEPGERIGRFAAQRTARRLGSRRIATRQCPVLFEAPVAVSLIGHLVGALRGSSLYRQASFLLGQLDKPLFQSGVRIHEQPHLPRGAGSTAYDNEGVGTRDRDLVSDGILTGYVLDSYSGRKLGMQTTGNAGGVHNLTLEAGTLGFEELLREMGSGVLVTELIGQGVNTVTGDYSRGAAGFWVENGEIQYPVEEITIAGNLRDMYGKMNRVGSDVDTRGNLRSGSVLIDGVTVAGS
ncbi:MAG: metalloprotease PmbA [Gammaproteobacteria bacterium]|nr:metalloprotease PmbA [Gammaproteobacteria bacterium]